MTYKELLESLSFDEILPYLTEEQASYKLHYDMLLQLEPSGNDSEAEVSVFPCAFRDDECPRRNKCQHGEIDFCEKTGQVGITAFDLEIDWEDALACELVIDPAVTAPPAKIAAACLFHSSFYGYFPESMPKTGDRNELINWFLNEISPDDGDPGDLSSMLYGSKKIVPTYYPSFARDGISDADYLLELVERYGALDCPDRQLSQVVVCVTVPEVQYSSQPVKRLITAIGQIHPSARLIVKHGEQMMLHVAWWC